MKIEELNKMQIVLLTLLVSFVTSIATGIVTVTLMDQAPPGVTQTINRIVERTTEVVVPDKSQTATIVETVIIKEEDFIVDAAEMNNANVVQLGGVTESGIIPLGTAFAVSGNSMLIVDRSNIPQTAEGVAPTLVITTANGNRRMVEVLPAENKNLALLKVIPSEDKDAEPLVFNALTFVSDDAIKIGQTAIALGMDDTVSLSVGTISQLETVIEKDENGEPLSPRLDSIITTISMNDSFSGGPVLNTNGEVMGIAIVGDSSSFAIPASHIRAFIDGYKKSAAKDSKKDAN